jgi:membrane protein YqaA with SNARE-associated domain
MENFQAYIFLLNDSILGSLMFVPGASYAGDVMSILGRYNLYYILIISLVGSIIGASLNWLIGSLLRKIKLFSSREEVLEKAEVFFNKKGKWILLLSMIPLWGALFTTAAGVLRFNFKHFLILVIFSKFVGFSLAIFF